MPPSSRREGRNEGDRNGLGRDVGESDRSAFPPCLTASRGGYTLSVLVQPRASKNEIVGVHGGALKIRLTAPPVEGAANKACLDFLARLLGVRRSEMSIVGGHASREKKVFIKTDDLKGLISRLGL